MMTDREYEALREDVAKGRKVAHIGGRSASTVEELDIIIDLAAREAAAGPPERQAAVPIVPVHAAFQNLADVRRLADQEAELGALRTENARLMAENDTLRAILAEAQEAGDGRPETGEPETGDASDGVDAADAVDAPEPAPAPALVKAKPGRAAPRGRR